jgi:signal transduction histidine kinase
MHKHPGVYPARNQAAALDLRPSLLDDLGLASALRWHVDHYSQLTDLKSQFITNISDMRFPADIETNATGWPRKPSPTY